MKNTYKKHLYVLVLAGGPGTRLWPLSTNKTPKQFIRLFAGKTLFEITMDRVSKLVNLDRIYVATVSDDYKEIILTLYSKLKPENIIVEPVVRDSGPAHGLAALYLKKIDKDAVIVNAASDQIIDPEENYLRAMNAAANFAYDSKMLVAVGVKPTYAHTGSGYLKKGKKVAQVKGMEVFKVDMFREKPKLSLAKKYISGNDFFWNANNYVWRADAYLLALEKYASSVFKLLKVIDKAIGKDNEKEVISTQYPKMPKISVDYGVSEKSKDLCMVIGEYYWSDVSNWKEVWRNLEKDDLENAILTFSNPDYQTVLHSAKDNLIISEGMDVVVAKVKGLVVVASKNGVLISNKRHSQELKTAVSLLMDKKHKQGN